MTISIDKVINDIIPVIIGATKKVTGPHTFVRLTADQLGAMTTADTAALYWGKFISSGCSDAIRAKYGTEIIFTTETGSTATGGMVGTFYDQYFNNIEGGAAADGTLCFVGVKMTIANV